MEQCTPKPAAPGVSLTILPGSNPPRKKSTMGWKRALVLTGVWLLMISHIILWLAVGSTLTPVEPSESMQTAKDGIITMGTIFFAVALISTAIFGRWFCGWGCHWVALQDGAAWLLKRVGVRPRPFRSRLLLWMPLALALYMFVWPIFYRLAVAPWIGHQTHWNGFTTHFVTSDFWGTFPGAVVAIPFILVCGGFIIYLMGAKGYCTYACPYGGFFAPLDEVAPMRIVVDTDKCHHCGHCTAVCTSNVRVHEEIRDYGAVVDPGCMKCMDCVSVCPNNALSFGVFTPAIKIKRTGTAAAASAAKRWDLSWAEEIGLLVVALLAFFSVRGNYLSLPLLFSSGFAMCVTFIAWKAWHALHDPNAAFHQWQLRFHGKLRAAGAAWIATAGLMMVLVLYVGAMNLTLLMAERTAQTVIAPADTVFSDQRIDPPAETVAAARDALAWYRRASMAPVGYSIFPLAQGGIDRRMAWMNAVIGDMAAAEANYRAVWEREGHLEDIAAAIGRTVRVQDNRETEAIAWYEQQLQQHPDWQDLRQEYIYWLQYTGDPERILKTARAGYEAMPTNLRAMRQYSMQLVELGTTPQEVQKGIDLIVETLKIEPNNGFAYAAMARGLLKIEKRAEAIAAFERAAQLEPNSEVIQGMLQEVRESKGNPMNE